MGANAAAREAANRLDYIKKAIEVTPTVSPELRQEARSLELQLMEIREAISGDPTKPRRAEPEMPGVMNRVQQIVRGHWSSTSAPTATHRKNYEIAAEEFSAVLDELRALVEIQLVALEERLEEAGVPWTPGRRVPKWSKP